MKIISKEFILKIDKIITINGCWLAVSSHVSNSVWYHGKAYKIHRVAAYLWHGGFNLFKPNDATICHTCKNDTTAEFVCFNPEHLYVGTDSSNMLDSVRNRTHTQSRKMLCPNGHSYSETRIRNRNGKKIVERICTICRARNSKRWRDKR